jgi:hypothetical protein
MVPIDQDEELKKHEESLQEYRDYENYKEYEEYADQEEYEKYKNPPELNYFTPCHIFCISRTKKEDRLESFEKRKMKLLGKGYRSV